MVTKVDIGTEIKNGWELFKANMVLLILANLVAGLLTVFTCGILLGPMMAGLYLIIQRLLKKDPVTPQIGDLFKGFSYFLNTFLYMLILVVIMGVLGVIPVIGQLVSIVLSPLLLIGIMFIVFGQLSFSDALKKVIAELKAGGPFWMFVLVILIANFISGAGMIAFGIGTLFTAPLAACIIVGAYHTAYGDAAVAPEQAPQETPPAAPAE